MEWIDGLLEEKRRPRQVLTPKRSAEMRAMLANAAKKIFGPRVVFGRGGDSGDDPAATGSVREELPLDGVTFGFSGTTSGV